MTVIDGLIKHEFNIPQTDDAGPHDHAVASDYNNGHVLSGGTTDGDLLTWESPNTSKGKFRTLVGGTGITVIIAASTITVGFTGGVISPAVGGTGLDTSASSGVPSINAGTWIINNVLTANRLLVAAAGNQIQSFAALTYNGTSFALTTVGPHSIGGATAVNVALYIQGSFTAGAGTGTGTRFEHTVSPAVAADGVSIIVAGTLNKAASGTHANFFGVRLDAPSIGAGASTLTNAATLAITGAPTAGANNFALWVQDGLSHFARSSAPAILVQPSGANSSELWMRHGSVAVNSKFISDGSFNLDIHTNNTLAIRVAGTTQATEHRGVGPHSFGGAPTTSAQLTMTGTFTGVGQTEMLRAQTTLQGLVGANSFGLIFVPVFVEAASGTHGQLTGIYVLPTFTGGGAATTSVFGINIDVISTAAVAPTNVAALRIGSPTGATNNYVILNDTAGGLVRFDTVGPYSFGGSVNLSIQHFFQGSFTSNAADSKGVQLNSTLAAGADGGSLIGLFVSPTLVERAAGTHPIEAGIYVSPSITNGAALATTVAGVYVEQITAPAGAANAAALHIKAPTGGTINRSIHVASGLSQFDGILAVSSGGGAVNTTNIGIELRGSTTPSMTWFNRSTVTYLPAIYDALRHNITFSSGAANDGVGLYVSGTFASLQTFARAMQIDATITAAADGGNLDGIFVNPVLTERSGGTHARAAGIYVQPSVTAGGANVTEGAGIYVDAVTFQTTTTDGAALILVAPTGATNNYGLLVKSGSVRFSSAGGHAIGGAIDASKQLLITGTNFGGGSGVPETLRITTSLQPGASSNSHCVVITPTFVEGTGGAHTEFNALYVEPAVTAGTSTLGTLHGIQVASLVAQSGTTSAIGLKLPLPTGATTNLSMLALGPAKFDQHIRTTAPNTRTTATYTVADTDNYIISDQAATLTVTLPTASSYTGRALWFQTYQAQTIVSDASNVVPKGGGAAGTAIIPATDGAWAMIVSDGTNWIIMASGT